MERLLNLRVLLLACFIQSMFSSEEVVQTVTDSETCSSGDLGCTKKKSGNEDVKIRLALPMLDGVKVGHEQEIEVIKGRKHKMKTLSLEPPIFEIPEFFSADECELVIDLASRRKMEPSPLVKDPIGLSSETSKGTFDEWDMNSDKFVDVNELLYLRGKSDLYLSPDDIEQMMKDLDIDQDGNGKISLEEFSFLGVDAFKQYFDKLRETNPQVRSRNSKQTWLWHDEDELLQYEDLFEDYHDRFARLTKLPRSIVETSEPLQIIQYDEQGFSHCHHDSAIVNKSKPCCTYGAKDCRICRYVTVQVFLKDVEGGELAFPVADNETFTWESWTKESITKCNLVNHCKESHLVVKPQRGKAVLYYNHLVDKKSKWISALDPKSFNGICSVKKGQSWTANMWININGDGITELRSWKMGSNLLSGNTVDQETISALKTEEEYEENRYTAEKNRYEEKAEDIVLNTPPERVGEELKKDERKTTPSKETLLPLPVGPDPTLKGVSAPFPLPKEDLEPKGPEVPFPPLPKEESGNRILRSIMLLIDELDQVELEIVARNLHTRLKLVCVPLMINPMGPLR